MDKEKKIKLLGEVFEKMKSGHPITGDNAACSVISEPISYITVYNWLQEFPELREKYRAMREESKQTRMSSAGRISVATKREMLKRVIAYIAEGYTVRGKHSAVLRASKELNIKPVHWQTVHVWLRRDFNELKESYLAAKEARKRHTELKRKAME